jgi:6-phosphogluconolactonase (cycloisomerase 2 family)
LFAANYAGGSVAAFPIQPNGALGEASSFFQHSLTSIDPRQRESHAHVVVPSPDNRFLLVADLGGDRVFVYRFDGKRLTNPGKNQAWDWDQRAGVNWATSASLRRFMPGKTSLR